MSKFLGRNKNPTIKQLKTKQKILNVKVPMLKINKSELKTNETLIIQVKNALFYRADKNTPQLGLHKSPLQKIIH